MDFMEKASSKKRLIDANALIRDMLFDPYVMVYDKPNAPKEIKRLQRWCNNKIIFKKCPDFKNYS